ncbi:MAG: S26 family signal peptidase [Betaproteobacteria bacterium]|nr:S26 family signal peptidase [Betaproteobacteria bacterium]
MARAEDVLLGRRRHSRRPSRIAIAATAGIGLAALAWSTLATPSLQLIYNVSDSVPIGWYRIRPAHDWHVGSIVLAKVPAAFRRLAAERSYLPIHVPILKRIGAVSPQHVCILGRVVYIDFVPIATILEADRLSRRMPAWAACRRLTRDELFLLSVDNPASFDSRYFGPIQASTVIGRADRIWPQTGQ